MDGLNKKKPVAHTNIVLDVSQIIAPIVYLIAEIALSILTKISAAINYIGLPRKNCTDRRQYNISGSQPSRIHTKRSTSPKSQGWS